MLALHLKIAFRNMWKYRTQSLTGIFGLAFGLACFVPALYWMYYETSYDSSYPEAENIYRIYGVDKQSGNVNKSLSKVYEKTLCEQFPAVEASAVCITGQEENCRTDNIPYVRLSMLYAENAFFDVFPQKFICGDAERPLQVIDNIVLTETMATRLFGDPEKAIGPGAEYDKGGLAALYGHGSGGRPAGQLEFLVRRDYLQQYGQAIC